MTPEANDALEAILSGRTVRELEHMQRNLTIVNRLMDLADRAALAYHSGDFAGASQALADYHALRMENAER